MPVSLKVEKKVTIHGSPHTERLTVTADNQGTISPTLAAAKTGTLSTRTDNDTGTITGQASHGVTTGARLDIYWFNADGSVAGSRRGVTVGTVSGNSIPIDSGAGDNLPIATTALTIQVPNSETVNLTGANAVAVYATIDKPGIVVYAQTDDTEIAYKVFDGVNGGTWAWVSGFDDATNPITGQTVGKVFWSQGDATEAPGTCEAGILYN